MPREWTEEQREESRQRAKAHGFGKKSKASVDVIDNPPVGRSADVFMAEHEGKVSRTVETADSEDGTPITITHERPGRLVMYKPVPGVGYEPRTVAASAIRMLLIQGWHENCPDCGKKHVSADGVESTDPNLCAVKPPIALRVCPVCQKRLYDNVGANDEGDELPDDPNVIKDSVYATSTPASRTEASLNVHMWVRHPRRAQMMNVPPLPAAMGDLVEEAKPI